MPNDLNGKLELGSVRCSTNTEKDLDPTAKCYSSIKTILKAQQIHLMGEICELCKTSTSQKLFLFFNQKEKYQNFNSLRG